NDNNANLKYPSLDRAIEETFAAQSVATNKNSLYDSYVRAIRWALTRIGDAGIVGFVTNGGFIDANTADGLRKTLAEECTDTYVYNLRGNARSSGEQRRKERCNVFGAGARTTDAITFLIKDPAKTGGKATVPYRDIGDYLSRADTLTIVAYSQIDALDWQPLTPNDAGDWINQRTDAFETYQALGDRKQPGAIFGLFCRGLETGRDPWVYNADSETVAENVSRTIHFYNTEVDR